MPSLMEQATEQAFALHAIAAQAHAARGLETAARQHEIAGTNAQALAQLINLRYVQAGLDSIGVEHAYKGLHLKSAAEADAAQSVAEGNVYKGESLASFPQTQAQHSAQLLDLDTKIASLAATIGALAKIMQTTPPQTGGHAAEAPGELKKSV